jgi:hypothetical protein
MFASPLSNTVYDNTNYIFGSGRSGTSVLYKILHSCNLVMADYEPPVMQSCLGLMKDTYDSGDYLKTIFKTYLGEEFFINYLLTRKINKNLNEFSTIYDVKGHDFISMLKTNFNSRSDVEAAAKVWTILVKLPNLSSSVEKLVSSNSKIVLTHRNPDEVISSGLLKGWYNDRYLLARPSWPYIVVDDFPVPYWVSEELTETWVRGDEIDRALVNYYEMQKVVNSLAMCRDCIDVHYEMLVSEPVISLEKIFEFLGFKQGPKTASLIEKVKPQTADQVSPDKWRSRLIYREIMELEGVKYG